MSLEAFRTNSGGDLIIFDGFTPDDSDPRVIGINNREDIAFEAHGTPYMISLSNGASGVTTLGPLTDALDFGNIGNRDYEYGGAPFIAGEGAGAASGARANAYRWHNGALQTLPDPVNPTCNPLKDVCSIAGGVDSSGDVFGLAIGATVSATVWPGTGSPFQIRSNKNQMLFPTSGIRTANGTLYVLGRDLFARHDSSFYYDSSTKQTVPLNYLVSNMAAMDNSYSLHAANDTSATYTFMAAGADTVLRLPIANTLSATSLPMSANGIRILSYPNQGALSINRFGLVVGADYGNAVLWRRFGFLGGTPFYSEVNLNDDIPASDNIHLSGAYGINDYNEIVGLAAYNGATHFFLYRPVMRGIDISPLHAMGQGNYIFEVPQDSYKKLIAGGPFTPFVSVELYAPVSGVQYLVSAKPDLDNASFYSLATAGYVFLNLDPAQQWPTCPATKRDQCCNAGEAWGTCQMRLGIENIDYTSPVPTVDNLYFIAIDIEPDPDYGKANHLSFDGRDNPAVNGTVRKRIIDDAIAAAPPGIPIAIYTSQSGWTTLLPNLNSSATNPFSACPLWDVKWDQFDDLKESRLPGTSPPQLLYWFPSYSYGGWTHRDGKQIANETLEESKELESYTGIASLDTDVFDLNMYENTQCFGGSIFPR